jgi:hypothetical protein
MTRRVADAIVRMPERDRFIRGMVAWLGFKQAPFPYDRDARFAGSTTYTLGKLLNFGIDAIVSFSMVPLRIATYCGALLTVVLAFVGIYAIIGPLLFGTVPGWSSLTLLIVGVSAVQLLVLGVIGEYVGRIFLQSKSRPLFLIAELQHASRTSASRLRDTGSGPDTELSSAPEP